MKNQPKFIYLQTGLEEYGEVCEDFNTLDSSSISWCADKIFDDDLQYVSVFSVLAEIDKLTDYATFSDNYEEVALAIRTLKNLIK
jgi:hypothetical protein